MKDKGGNVKMFYSKLSGTITTVVNGVRLVQGGMDRVGVCIATDEIGTVSVP